ncbi:MAG TPA: SET domain-containing protein [Flavisolibacter sp.]|nr:SET domain-containing protein [Flavisolibacter sp.]
MALLEKELVVKPSTIPGSGMGLFTTVFIPKGTRIAEYKGRITTWKEVKHDSDNGYIYTINDNHVIDARPYLKAMARYANDARGLVRIKGITNNCTYVNEGLRAFIEALKDIPAGSEIFVSYGKEYWDVVRENIRADKLAKSKTEKKAKSKSKAKR